MPILFLKKRIILLGLIPILIAIPMYGQITMPRVSFTKTIFPDTSIAKPITNLYLDPALPDVKAIGKGSTSLTNWNGYIGMLNNPASLSHENIAIEIADAQITIPQSTLIAISYLNSNKENLKEGRYFNQLLEGIWDLRNYKDIEEKEKALDKIYEASAFGDDLLTNVIGTTENPIHHGFLAFPNFKFQYKNFGVSLYKLTQTAFMVTGGSILDAIRDVHKIRDGEHQDEAILRLTGLLYDVYNNDGVLNPELLPVIFSVAATNTALSLGYGKEVNDRLSLGANLNFYRRALSISIIEQADYNKMMDVALVGLDKPVYDVNLTAGLTYKQSDNFSFGMVASNIFPSKKIESGAVLHTYDSDMDYTIHRESWMDSVSINLYSQKSETIYPYALSIPFVLSTGATWLPIQDLYLSAEWIDMLANDNVRYKSYYERFQLGAEYSFLKKMVSVRAGMTRLKPTIGGGISIPIWDFKIDLDAAYAFAKITNTAATFIQLKFSYQYNKRK